MRDRVSTKILDNGATRYGVYDETGALLRYEYIKLEDEPSTEGDFFNKANMLPDSIPKLLGLKMENPQVKDALNVLANVGNLHVWERVQTYADPVPATYEYGDEETINVYGPYAYGGDISTATLTAISWTYGDITVENGYVELINSTTGKVTTNTYGSLPAEFAGRYISLNSTIYYCPDTAYMNTRISGSYYTDICGIRPVKYVPSIPAGTYTDYLTSTDRNAYPDKSAAGGQDAYYTLGDTLSNYDLGQTAAAHIVTYSSDIVVDDGGTVTLVDPSSITTSKVESLDDVSILLGKFVTTSVDSSGSIVFIPTDATASYNQVNGWSHIFMSKYQPVIGHAAIPANTTITYLGQLGGGARIEVGSYVGTGTYGESNPNTITFDFAPKLVWIIGPSNGSFNVTNTPVLLIYDRTFYYNGNIDNTSGVLNLGVTWGDKFVSYYYKSGFNGYESVAQLNANGETYSYIAIG